MELAIPRRSAKEVENSIDGTDQPFRMHTPSVVRHRPALLASGVHYSRDQARGDDGPAQNGKGMTVDGYTAPSAEDSMPASPQRAQPESRKPSVQCQVAKILQEAQEDSGDVVSFIMP